MAGADARLYERTWDTLMTEFSSRGNETSRSRKQRAMQNRAFDPLRIKPKFCITWNSLLITLVSAINLVIHEAAGLCCFLPDVCLTWLIPRIG
jgi:hypothetical protein